MQINWSAYRITLLLYAGVLLLPFGFYYSYSLFDEVHVDTAVMKKLSISGGEILLLSKIENREVREKKILTIDRRLKKIEPWIKEHNEDRFYVGGQSFLIDYNQLIEFWNNVKKSVVHSDTNERFTVQSWQIARRLSFSAEKMLDLKQERIYNFFYINFAITMIFLFLLVFIVRAYIYRELEKSAIYDLRTKLYNKNYFLSSLEIACSRSSRHDSPLSMMLISLENCGSLNKTYDDKTKKNILEMFGGLVISLTRSSDIAARHEDSLFTIILPDTQEDNALILQKRIYEALAKHEFSVFPEFKFSMVTVAYDKEETLKMFIERAIEKVK